METTQPHGVQGIHLFILYPYQFNRDVNIHRDNFAKFQGKLYAVTHTFKPGVHIFSNLCKRGNEKEGFVNI